MASKSAGRRFRGDEIKVMANERRFDMTRRTFIRELKIEAAATVTDRGLAMAQAVPDLEVAESVLRRWIRELTEAPLDASPNHPFSVNVLRRKKIARRFAQLAGRPSPARVKRFHKDLDDQDAKRDKSRYGDRVDRCCGARLPFPSTGQDTGNLAWGVRRLPDPVPRPEIGRS